MAALKGNGLHARPASSDAAGAATLLLGADGVVTHWSRGAEELFGRPAADALGQHVTALLTPQDAARVPGLARRCHRDGGWSGRLSARHRDGRVIAIEAQVVPWQGWQGQGRQGQGPRGQEQQRQGPQGQEQQAQEPQGQGPQGQERQRQGPPGQERQRPGARVTDWLVLAVGVEAAAGRPAMDRAVLELMVTQSPVGMAVLDTELRFVWANAALEQFGGGTVEQRRGRRIGEIQPHMNAEPIEALMRRVLATGVPVLNHESVGRALSDPGRDRAFSWNFIRLDDDGGRPVGVYYSVVDITDRHRSRKRLSLLDRAGERIGRSLDVMRTAQDLADAAVPDLAEFVAVDLLDSVIRGAEPTPGPIRDTAPLRRGGHQSIHAGVPEAVVGIGGVADYHDGSPPMHVLTSGTSWRAARLDSHAREWATQTPAGPAAGFGELGLYTSMVVPIRARGITLGIATFFRLHDEPFEEDDLRLAEDFVARAAVCIDNARRYTRERDAALVLQRSLLLRSIPEQDAVEVASRYRPADELTGVGGDWFDVIPLSGARVALVVGEVVGYGIDAAALMGQQRTAVRTLADLDLRPEEVLAHLDDLVTQAAHEEDTGAPVPGATATGSSCLYLVYDPVSRRCSMASAGHSPPAYLAPDGTVSFPELPVGPPLGLGGLPFESVESVLAEGSVLALYTDGLVPDAAPETARERLCRALEARGLPLDALCRAVVDRLAPVRPRDDVALLLARTRTLDADRVASWDLPADPAVVARARESAERQLAGWGLEDLAFTTALVVSELVTNAVRHASGPIRLRLIRARTLICEVSDGSSTAPYLRHARAIDEGGRGLFLVSQFAHRWGTRYTTDGKVIWAEQLIAPDTPSPDAVPDPPPHRESPAGV
ncbi:SpoIIE family protein phosphatase [Streptomyces sp. NPDC048277]|uniref:SpoIIE family protein phosphatase n=1 Tax=Streptomyces sp. NPDC048277 TaxID=3155027 RepID=UPI003401E448